MKKRRATEPFLKELRKVIEELARMKPGEVHVLSVNANYGRYEIVIGAEHGKRGRRRARVRPIEINGEIHHLFVSPRRVRAMPSKNQVLENLKDTVIVRDLTVHMVDPEGDGKHLEPSDDGNNGIHIREYINLAGARGKELLEEVEHSDRISMAAYRIIQDDILGALKMQRNKRRRERAQRMH